MVADHLRVPWGLAMLPDGTALVGERPTGRIVRVQPAYSPVQVVRTIPGVDPTGDGGLLGLALSPTYDEDGLVFAYVSTKTDNRIVRFSLQGDVQPILTGIPHGGSDNGGRIAFGPDGYLYVGTGDAGRPALAAQPDSLAGKILRIDVFGHPAPGNPRAGSVVYARGFRDVLGIAFDRSGTVYGTDLGGSFDELDVIRPGADYGWGSASRGTPATAAAHRWRPSAADPGGLAVLGRGIFVGQLAGHAVDALPLGGKGNHNLASPPTPMLKDTFGRLRTVVAAPDGALWATTSNRDGRGRPGPSDDRVLRILPPPDSTNSQL